MSVLCVCVFVCVCVAVIVRRHAGSQCKKNVLLWDKIKNSGIYCIKYKNSFKGPLFDNKGKARRMKILQSQVQREEAAGIVVPVPSDSRDLTLIGP